MSSISSDSGLLLSRRGFLVGAAGAAALGLAGCSSSARSLAPPGISPRYLAMYGPREDEQYPLPPVDLRQVNPDYLRVEVVDPTGEKPGTLVVHTADRYLYHVQPGGTAIRYGVGIGRDGFTWSGRGTIGRKAEWPTWYPPRVMQAAAAGDAAIRRRHAGRARQPARARGRCTSTATAATPSIGCTARANTGASGRRCPRAACGSSTRT